MFFILVGKSENDHDKGCRTLNPVRPILSVPWKLYEGLPRSPAAYLTWPEMSFNGVYGRSRYKFWFWQAGPKNCFIYWCSWREPSILSWAFMWVFTNKFTGKMWKTCHRHRHLCHPCHRHPDLEFVKKFTRPNFRAKEFCTLKTRKSRLFLPAINNKNASLSVI